MHREWLTELMLELDYLKFKAPQPQGHATYEYIERRGLAPAVAYARKATIAAGRTVPIPAELKAAIAASMKKEAEKRMGK